MGWLSNDMAQREPKRLECKECDYTTRSHDSLSKHTTAKHYPDLFQPCQYCHFVSTDATKVRLHVTQVHVRRKRYNCKQCNYIGKEYVGKSERCLEKHVATEHQSDLTTLEETDSTTKIELDSDGSEDHKCHKCDFSTPMSRTLDEHILRPHLNCKKCGDFSTVFRLRMAAHEKTCGEKKEHGYLYIDGVDKPYHCPHCGFDAVTKNFVLKHMDRCQKENKKDKTNSKCDESDFMPNEPEKENQRHAKAKPASSAKPHINARRPFGCPRCKLSFSDKDEAMLHSRKRHIKCDEVNCEFITTHMDISRIHRRDCLKAKSPRGASQARKDETRKEAEDSDCEIIEEKRPRRSLRAPVRGQLKNGAAPGPQMTVVKDPWESMWAHNAADPDPEATNRLAEQQRVRNMSGTDYFRKMQEEFAKKEEEEFEKNNKEMKESDAQGRESDSGNETKDTISDNDEERMQEDPAEDNVTPVGERAEGDDGVDREVVGDDPSEGRDLVAAALVEVGLLEPIVSMHVGGELSVSDDEAEKETTRVKEPETKRPKKEKMKKKKKKKKGLPPFFRAFLRGKAVKEESAEMEDVKEESMEMDDVDGEGEEKEDDDRAEKAPCDLCPFVAGDQNLLTSHILKMHVVG